MEEHTSWPGLDQKSFYKILQSIPEGLFIMDQQGSPIFINQIARELLQLHENSLTCSAVLSQILSFDPLQCHEAIMKETLIHRVPYQVLVAPFDVSSSRGIILFFKNLSEVRQAEELKTDFISIASHELRNPLTSIKNALDILIEKSAGEINTEQAGFLNIAIRNVNRISKLVNEYLDLSKIELGTVAFQFRSLRLDEMVSNIVEEFKEQAKKKKITLHFTIPPRLPHIIADPYKLEEIFFNLLQNALEYSKEGGEITVAAKEIKLSPKGNQGNFRSQIEVSIADTGIGIPAEQKRLVFEKFYRLNKTTEQPKKGAGLGLAIVKNLVERHGGTIYVENNQPVGSRFCFTLLTCKGERRDLGFRFLFDKEFQRAKQNYSILSILAVLIEGFQSIRQKVGKEKADIILKQVEAAVDESLYHKADTFAHYKQGEIFVVFCDAEKKGVEVICKRIKENIVRSLGGQESSLKQHLSIRLGTATYPVDADNQRDLFRKAVANARGEQDGPKEDPHH